jgi:hypothetical protein
MQLGGISADDAALAVPDGTGDNVIDALYYDRLTKTMYVFRPNGTRTATALSIAQTCSSSRKGLTI